MWLNFLVNCRVFLTYDGHLEHLHISHVSASMNANGLLILCLQEYELNSNKYRSALGKPEINTNIIDYITRAEAVQRKVGCFAIRP